MSAWTRVTKFDVRAVTLADGHYSRRTPGSPQFMPPGQTLVLWQPGAVFGWWRPHPRAGIRAMNGLDGWTCTIFRNVGGGLSSQLILEAEDELHATGATCGPDGLLTYVWSAKVRSTNPGYCFKCAGWIIHPTRPLSADGRKVLLSKPWAAAGVAPFSEAA